MVVYQILYQSPHPIIKEDMNPELADQIVQDKELADVFERLMHDCPDWNPDELARWLIILKHELEYRGMK
jgi:Asp-tRNA(Asn)/Glu-tRNA(Gln) amidotransferase B subunit